MCCTRNAIVQLVSRVKVARLVTQYTRSFKPKNAIDIYSLAIFGVTILPAFSTSIIRQFFLTMYSLLEGFTTRYNSELVRTHSSHSVYDHRIMYTTVYVWYVFT